MRFKRPGEDIERSSKRQKSATMVVYRGPKPEMKHQSKTISHSAATESDTTINTVAASTNVAGRIGSKIKIWNIEGLLRTSTDYTAGLRLDILIPQVAGTLPLHGYSDPVDRDGFTVIKTIFLNPSAEKNTSGYIFNHKLRLGLVSKFDGPLNTDLVNNPIVCRIQTVTATSVLGYFRIWFTDV